VAVLSEVSRLLKGLVAALLTSTLIVVAASTGMGGISMNFGMWPLLITVVMLTGHLLLSELRRVRGPVFWMFAGIFTATMGLLAAGIGMGSAIVVGALSGAAGGWVHWRLAGRMAGRLAAALTRDRQASPRP